jgi:hypothetical protein
MRNKNRNTYSRTSPRENRRACLCAKGNTYSRKCCKGRMINQGIGSLYGGGLLLLENGSYLQQENGNNINL